jgi:hypothetical protein
MKSLPFLIPLHAMLLVFVAFASPGFSQEKMTFGQIDPSDLKMTRCPLDSSADAMVLGDVGQTRFEYNSHTGFYMIFDRLVRIKIFKKTGYNMANLNISLYHTVDVEELLDILKGRTYNLEDGKMVVTKVSNESVFIVDEDIHWKNIRIAFPAVREGSVIELRYSVKSQFYDDLSGWKFQWEIPVRWSSYEVTMPQFFHYARQTFGSVPFVIDKQTTKPNSLNNIMGSYNSVTYTDYILHLAAKDVPALKEEPYGNAVTNYVSRIEFVLQSYQYPDRAFFSLNSSWQQIAQDLMKDEDFGDQLRNPRAVAGLVASIKSRAKYPMDRMILGYDTLCHLLKWNGIFSKYPTATLNKAIENRSGNTADINLNLVSLMRGLGLRADPVLLSTRDHGFVLESAPSGQRMNDVICLVTIEGHEYLLDATDPFRSYKMLPFECLNGRGLVLSGEVVRWIDLVNSEKNTELYFGEFRVDASGEISGTLTSSLSGYSALQSRTDYILGGREAYAKSLKLKTGDWNIDEISFENADSLSKPLKISYGLNSSEISQVAGDLIYFTPIQGLFPKINPFLPETRNTPVDFGFPFKESYVLTYEIPDGYIAESIPANIKLTLPNQSGTYLYTITVSGNKISLNSQLSISETIFEPGVYGPLRNLYIQMITKQGEQIVLKKGL